MTHRVIGVSHPVRASPSTGQKRTAGWVATAEAPAASPELKWTATPGMLYRITFAPGGGASVVDLAAGSTSYSLSSRPTGIAKLQAVWAYPSTQWVSASTAGVGYVRGQKGVMACG